MNEAKFISIIICSRKNDIPFSLKENIKETIGCAHELIIIDNSSNKYTIFQAYNIGVSKAKGSILCFAHDDILFRTINWGNKVINHFQNQDIGMIGVTGGNLCPISPSPWWNVPKYNDHLMHLVQHWKTKKPLQNYHTYISEKVSFADERPNESITQPAVLIDGLWFCIRASLFKEISFDEKNFNGFHCYDADISLQVFEKKKNRVVFDILIEHLSDASINKAYFDSYIRLAKKWLNKSPFYAKKLNIKQQSSYESKALIDFIYSMQSSKLYSDNELKKVIKSFFYKIPFHWQVYEYYQLYFWSLLGYKVARLPNYIFRKILVK